MIRHPLIERERARYTFPWRWDPARYPPAYLRAGLAEGDVQRAVLDRLLAGGHFAVPVDSGAKHLRGRAAGALRRAGVANPDAVLFGRTGAGLAGLADVVGCTKHGRMLAIECKRPAHYVVSPKTGALVLAKNGAPGEATDQQLRFLDECHRRGGIAGVVWAVRDLEELLAEPRLAEEDVWEPAQPDHTGKDLEKGPA